MRRPIALVATYVRWNAGNTRTHPTSTLRFAGDMKNSPITPTSAPSPWALSMIAKEDVRQLPTHEQLYYVCQEIVKSRDVE